MESSEDAPWPMGAQIKLGAALVKFLIETAWFTSTGDGDGDGVEAWDKNMEDESRSCGQPQAAFVHNVMSNKVNRRQGTLSLTPEVFRKVSRLQILFVAWDGRTDVIAARM